ncbi:hypothetical protein [Amycolatopsis sp. NPDC051071]|uniref:hypothetical protein n=1 Tax=Amycolatopsis sp. NPDC051071 TaxID=3154637 RepID=UPI0034375F87
MSADVGHTMIVGGLRGDAEEVFPLRAGVALPAGSAVDMVLAADTPEFPQPECYSAAEWTRLVAGTRERGVAIDRLEEVSSAYSVVAPVHTNTGRIVAAVGAVVLNGGQLASMATNVRRAANMVTTNLGRLPARRSRAFWLDD